MKFLFLTMILPLGVVFTIGGDTNAWFLGIISLNGGISGSSKANLIGGDFRREDRVGVGGSTGAGDGVGTGFGCDGVWDGCVIFKISLF